MKVLCLCEYGVVRSGGFARFLRERGGHDAVAASVRYNTPATLRALGHWADRIVFAEEWLQGEYHQRCYALTFAWKADGRDEAIRQRDASLAKSLIWDVGPDRFGSPCNAELERLAAHFAARDGL